MDLTLERTHIFRSPSEPQSTLVTRWFDRRADIFHELSWHIDGAWNHKVTSLLWQELVGGGGIDRLSDRALYGESDVLLAYGMQGLLRIGAIVSFPLACGESSRSGLSK